MMKNEDIPNIGRLVRQIRLDKGMSLETLSCITKIKIEELSDLEQGVNCPVPDYFLILTALGYDWDQILDLLQRVPSTLS